MEAKNNKNSWNIGKILFGFYLLFLFYFLLLSDWYGRTGELQDYRYNLELFKEIRRFWVYRREIGIVSVTNLLGNILIFVPIGLLLPIASTHTKWISVSLYGFGVSFTIEMIQLITKVGSFDVDDLFLNTLGVMIGWMMFRVCHQIRRMYRV